MKKLFLLYFLFSIFLQSCNRLEIADNTRVSVNGKITSESDVPLENINVTAKIDSYILGETFTKNNGEFSFTSLESYYNDDFVVEINTNYLNLDGQQVLKKEDFTTIILRNKEENEFRRAKNYNLGNIEIKRLSNLEIVLQKTSSEEKELNWNLTFPSPRCFIEIENSENLQQTDCYEEKTYYGNYSGQSEETLSLTSLLNTVVIFEYQIDEEETQIITIPLTEKNNTYVFEY